jgi:putative ABC transport system ATP-binding protein
MSTPTVAITNVNHHYGSGESRKQVLHNATLELNPGEIVITTGPSGSGKTTLLTLIGALRSVQDGSVRVFDHELRGLSAGHLVDVRRRIGFIFQAHNLFDSLTAMQNVQTALALQHGHSPRHSHAACAAMLDQLGLGDRLHHKPGQLSGGQRQRVAIARALVNAPKLILADEPTAALDPDSAQNVVSLLKTMARRDGATVVIVTHDHRLLDDADRIVNLVDGRIISNVLVAQVLEVCEFLRGCDVFAGLTPQQLTEVAQKVRRESAAAGTSIVRQGEAGDRFYMVRSGRVSVTAVREGHSVHLADLGPRQFFGEAALITGAPRNATVTTAEPTELYSLSKTAFKAALDASAPFMEQVLREFFNRTA